MKAKQRLTVLSVCLVLALGLLAACAPSETKADGSDDAAESSSPINYDSFGRIGNNIGYAEDGGPISRITRSMPKNSSTPIKLLPMQNAILPKPIPTNSGLPTNLFRPIRRVGTSAISMPTIADALPATSRSKTW